jgi:hypothetical protein
MNELMTKNEEKVVTVKHAFSGKELVIVNNPTTICKYFDMGYIVVKS